MAETSVPYVSYGLAVSAEDEQRWHEKRAQSAQAACERGEFYYSHHKLKESFDWFGRAERLSGDASNVMLSYAMVALELGYYEICQPRFRLLRERYNLREAAFGEIWGFYRQGKEYSAARLLSRALSRSYISEGLATYAGRLAHHVGRPGWATLSNSGVLSVHTHRKARLFLDGDLLGEVEPGQSDLLRWEQETPSRSWRKSTSLSVYVDDRPVLGSPFDIPSLTHCESVVTAKDGHLEGWLWYPAEPDFVPHLWINGRRTSVDLKKNDTLYSERPLFRPWCFSIPFSSLPGRGKKVINIRETHQRLLKGAPLDPDIADILEGKRASSVSFTSVESEYVKLSSEEKSRFNNVSCVVVIPVYQHYGLTRTCVLSAVETVPADTIIIVVNDASPDRRITQFLESLAGEKRIILRTNAENKGFPYSVNVGLSLSFGYDAILLNSDTKVFPGWVERLRAWLRLPSVGTATPFSNDGGLTSYPNVKQPNRIPSFQEAYQLDQLCQRVEQEVEPITLPTGNGFCLAISAACLQKIGLMHDQLFAQGYAEENDFCLRALSHGFRHVAATNIYVWHRGHASFQSGYYGLMERNLTFLNALYPHYMDSVRLFEERDPLALRRRFLDEERLKEQVSTHGSVVFIQHKIGGGVARAVRERGRLFIEQGCLALSVVPTEKGCAVEVYNQEAALPNLTYALPHELKHFHVLLRKLDVTHIEWHHLAGHAPWIRELHRDVAVPYDVFVHDHVWFCPRIALLTGKGQYCGEPPAADCQACIERWGQSLEEDVTIPFLLKRSVYELTAARRVIAPSRDAARRLERHISESKPVDIQPLEDDFVALQAQRAPRYRHRKCRVGVLGGISRWKGYDVLLDLGRYIQAHHIPLEVILIGSTADDEALMQVGIHVTGAYHEKDVLSLIKAEEIDIGFIPSVAPETWCYVLGWLWKAGLHVLSFDIGASAERIKQHGRGQVVPLGVSVSFLAHYMLKYASCL